MLARGKTRLRALFEALSTTGFFSIAGSTIVNRILSFMSGILVVRLLSKTDYGVYSYAYNILNIALLFNGIGVASAFIQLCCEPGGNKKEADLERWGFKCGGLFDVLLSVILLFWVTFTPESMPGTRPLLQICALYPIPQFMFDMQAAALRAQLRNNDYATANVINTSCVVAGTVVGAFLFGAIGLLVGRVAGIVVSTILVFSRFGVPLLLSLLRAGEEAGSITLQRAELWDYARIAVSSALANGVASFTYLIGTFIIGQLLQNPLEVASYEAASAIPVALNFIPATLMTYVYPYFARNKNNLGWVRKYYSLLLTLTFVGFGIVAIVCFAAAPQIISLVYGAQYVSSVTAFRILIIGSWIGATFRIVSGNLLVTQRLILSNLVGNVLTVGSILILNLLLVPRMGAIGSAIAQTIGLCISGIFNTVSFSIRINRNPSR